MLARHQQPIVAIATAPGRGAVGIVRVSGRGLGGLIQALCGRVLKAREASYLPFRDADGEAIDQGLLLYFPAPASFTGEDVLELQGHGGPVVMQLLLERCLGLGARLAEPGEFTRRAFLNGKLDLAQAEGVADLIEASTAAAARSAVRSLSGRFSEEVHRIVDRLVDLRMLVEATLDFPDEEIDFLQKADAQGQLNRLRDQLATVQQKTRQGALLREGIKVVIAGQPNAGKSSLLNALAGAELAIVTPIAGTTRDVVQQAIQIEGVPIHVIDTAGLRDDSDIDEVERIGIARAWDQIQGADAVLFLHDLTRAGQPAYDRADAEIAHRLHEHLPDHGVRIDVWNKADRVAERVPDTSALYISAKTGAGLEALRQRLLAVAGWQSGAEGLYTARARHVAALARVAEHLALADAHLAAGGQTLDLLAEELRLAQTALNDITGAFGADDLLGVIFSAFCIGK